VFFAKGIIISPGQKWLRNSFLQRENFMQPNGKKTQACIEGALLFFPFKFGGAGWGSRIFYFFSFFSGSQYVPNMFPLSSQ
jgi:hypothetical protein